MATPPPIPQEELDDLVRRIESAGGKGRTELIEAAAGGDHDLAERIDHWLRTGSEARDEGGEDLHDRGTLVGDAEEAEGFRPDLAATLAGDEPNDPASSDPDQVRGEETKLLEPTEGDGSAEEPSGTSGSGSPKGPRPGDVKTVVADSTPAGGGFSSRQNQMIEGFEVVKLLGAGGMGSVYLCRQSSPQREVAVKVMLPGLSNARALQRFEFEIETLAKLSHPNVARLYEAGLHETPKGPTPYVAMEMVRGARTITEFVDEVDLDFDEKVELFIRGCRGVAFGHGRGVIHRDLKPPNLLVDERGEPKVIDFGVALAADDEAGRGDLVGTLQYMAPEQASRGEVGTATDVFALGMILFELLSGKPPYMVPGASLSEALEMITTVEVPSLSSRMDKVPRDVDAIVAKAMAFDPENRYATAGDLAADLQRYLDDEPTIARAPTFKESILRLVRKYRVETGFAAAAVLALVVGIITTAIFAYKAEGARVVAIQAEGRTRLALERIELQQQRTEKSLALFLSVLGKLEPSRIGNTMVEGMIDGLDREHARRGTDEDLVIDDIQRLSELAEVFSPTDVAVRVVEKHLEEPTLRMLPLIRDDRRTLANLNEFLGEMLAGIGRLEDAEAYYRISIDEWSAIEPRSGENRRRAGGNLADILLQRELIDDAISNLGALVEDGRDASGDLDITGLRHLNALAIAQAGKGDYEAAEIDFRESLAGYESLLRKNPTSDESLAREILQARINLGSVQLALGELEAAESILRLAADEMVRLPGMEKSMVPVRLNLGRIAMKQARFDKARSEFEDAVDIAVEQFGRNVPRTAEAMFELAVFLYNVDQRYAEAIPLFENVRDVRVEQFGPGSDPVLLSGMYLTLSYAGAGDLVTSRSLLDSVDAEFISAGRPADPIRLQMLDLFARQANAIEGVEGDRAATISLERLFDTCVETSEGGSAENDPRPECVSARRFLPMFYETMIESEPDGDWAERRDYRFGS